MRRALVALHDLWMPPAISPSRVCDSVAGYEREARGALGWVKEGSRLICIRRWSVRKCGK